MPKFPDSRSDADRLQMARGRTSALIDHVCALHRMQEANAIISYSDKLARQVPRSYAGIAFEQFRTSQFLFQVIRLCALWDICSKDRESIPTILALIDRPSIVALALAEVHARQLASGVREPHSSDDPEVRRQMEEWYRQDAEAEAAEGVKRAEREIAAARALAQRVQADPALAALRDFRDRHIAHNLDLPPVQPGTGPRYGDERRLLRQTVKVADWLYRGLCSTSFMWLDHRRQVREQARDLWLRCRFDFRSSKEGGDIAP